MRVYLTIFVLITVIIAVILYRKEKSNKPVNGLGAATITKPPKIRIVYSRKPGRKKIRIKSSKDAFKVFQQVWSKQIETREEMVILFLDSSNAVLGYYILSMGGINKTVVDSRLLFAVALKSLATSVIIAHNHPSGNLIPSKSDIELTKAIQKTGDLMEIKLLDHLIIGKDDYYSFADIGVI